MAEQKDAGSHAGLLNPEHYPDYLIHDPGEILLMLRRMKQHRVLLNVHIDRGGYRFVSAVLDCGPRGLILDVSPDKWLNTHALAADVLTCSAQLDGVRVQFDLHAASNVAYQGLPALFSALPKALLRLQRRDSFRLSVPMTNPVRCQITLHPPDCKAGEAPEGDVAGEAPQPVVLHPRVADVSMSGIALVFKADNNFTPSVGEDLPDCLISLPDTDTAKVRLKIRNLHHTTNPVGGRTIRAGCEIIEMPSRFTNQVQRYIFKIERERRLMESAD